MIRLDKYLADMGAGTRSEVKRLIAKGRVQVGGAICRKPEQKVEPAEVEVTVDGNPLVYQKYFYYMLNKPAGVVTAREDSRDRTVLDVMEDAGLVCPAFSELSPVGRLDKDTEGLLLLTNDGALSHRLLSPAHHVAKTYYAGVAGEMKEEDRARFREGIRFSDFTALPAELTILRADNGTSEVLIRIEEGKFHQVKRMVHAVGKEVTYLKRLTMGTLRLDENLASGEWRELTEAEVTALMDGEPPVLADMLAGKRAVIFDLDGTLVDSMWLWKEIDVEYLGRFGIPYPKDLPDGIGGMSFSETAAFFKERFQLPHSVEEIMADWNEMADYKYTHEIPLKPGAERLLRYLADRNIRIGIATSNSRQLVERVLTSHGITDYFQAIQTSCEAGKGKPAPDVYLLAAEKLGVAPAECLVFEDVLEGIQAGKAAGMTVCAVEDAYSAYQMPEKRQLADYVLDSFEELWKN